MVGNNSLINWKYCPLRSNFIELIPSWCGEFGVLSWTEKDVFNTSRGSAMNFKPYFNEETSFSFVLLWRAESNRIFDINTLYAGLFMANCFENQDLDAQFSVGVGGCSWLLFKDQISDYTHFHNLIIRSSVQEYLEGTFSNFNILTACGDNYYFYVSSLWLVNQIRTIS